jgi:EAL domain-containing protein (putative c-di-GMP-specific phosphodiesterase class I)
MSGNAYAVLIGINEYKDQRHLPTLRYAQKDCEDLRRALTDPKIGNFSEKDIKVLLGSEATQQNIRKALWGYTRKYPTSNDKVLVYFSGHGFRGGDQQQFAYLGTYDVLVEVLLEDPDAGLQMEFLRDRYFTASPAKSVLFILDCCYSGAFSSSLIKGSADSTTRALIDHEFFSAGRGRVAIAACPHDAVSRERSDLQNGILTHYIVKGLRGDAADPETGEVTLNGLLTYVCKKVPPEQPPVQSGEWEGRIVLSRPGRKKEHKLRKLDLSLASPVGAKPLSNPMEPYIPFVKNLLSHLAGDEPLSGSFVGDRILDAIRRASEADFAFVLSFDQERWTVKSQSGVTSDYANQADYIENAVSRARTAISSRIAAKQLGHLRFYPYDEYYPCYEEKGGVSKAFVAVPMHLGKVSEFMVIYGLRTDSCLLSDVYRHILTTIHSATEEMTSIQPVTIESAILDDIKRIHGYVPMELYNRRFEMFCERLVQMDVGFEPILHLEPGNLFIWSWEALARDPDTDLVPRDLLTSAELWGRQFATELDLHFARLAPRRYREALVEAKMERPPEVKRLSINVYPESLLRTAYFDALNETLNENRLLRGRIVLEISEKAPIPEEVEDIDTFKERLGEYVRRLRIRFAIDDFGVGYASVYRLAKLGPRYVKIDREMLHHDFTDYTIQFVLNVVTRGQTEEPIVVVEGFDHDSWVTLDRIYGLGIRYVQGYIIGRAGPNVYQLDTKEIQDFETLISGEDSGK